MWDAQKTSKGKCQTAGRCVRLEIQEKVRPRDTNCKSPAYRWYLNQWKDGRSTTEWSLSGEKFRPNAKHWKTYHQALKNQQ